MENKRFEHIITQVLYNLLVAAIEMEKMLKKEKLL